jgi:serine/threonine protein kinase
VLARVRALHAGGVTHRAIGPESVFLDATGLVALAPTMPVPELGGPDADPESCPPELCAAIVVRLPADIEAARQVLAESKVECDPRRVDVYQLGALLCRMATGETVVSYLRSPKTKSRVPERLQPLIERALGHNAADRFDDCDAFAAALEAAVREAAPAPDTPPGGVAISSPTPPGGNAPAPPSPSSAGAETLPFTRLGHYRVDKRIGRGGMGDVYLGFEEALQRPVAIKVLPVELARDEDFVRRFRAEATAVARLAHPNIVPIYFIGQDAGCHFFVMQYVEGESLDRLLVRKGRLGVEEALGILEQCLAGLGAAHQAGLVHRDVKPANILLDGKTGRALVADFGLVKTVGGGGMTVTGTVLGTVDYIAPEQARGRDVDGRADLYALGVLAYQMFSGRLPFKADSPSAMIFQHAYEKPPPLGEAAPDAPAALAAVVDRLMAKDPAARYQSCEDVLADVRRWRAGEPLSADAEAPIALRASQIIPAPELEPIPEPPLAPEPAGRWQRLRERLLDWLQARAPQLVRRLQNTEQQVDGAVAEYRRRRDRLAGLMEEAAESAGELAEQARRHREAAAAAARRGRSADDAEAVRQALREKEECERVAADLEDQAAEQRGHLTRMLAQLAQVDATLGRLRGQGELLQARLRVAAARQRMQEGSSRKRRLLLLAVGVVLGLVLLAGLADGALFLILAFRGTSPPSLPSPGAGSPIRISP